MMINADGKWDLSWAGGIAPASFRYTDGDLEVLVWSQQQCCAVWARVPNDAATEPFITGRED